MNLRELARINAVDADLNRRFSKRLEVQPSLTRQLVSFQANKERAAYRWYKYKEAFSAALVEHLLCTQGIVEGPILDPFAGMGTTLFSASSQGLNADGIELLPIGQQIIRTRLSLQDFEETDLAILTGWKNGQPWNHTSWRIPLPSLRITQGAYPVDTLAVIERYLSAIQSEDLNVQGVLRFALLCVLESVSYTRKDGQYLRWDHRSGRRQGAKPFNKGRVVPFDEAIAKKLSEITDDSCKQAPADLFPDNPAGRIKLLTGSCLDLLPTLAAGSYSAIITSPPYCNRYDYTRTYALELALLEIGERQLVDLRQQMLSCTVENRAKDLLAMNPNWKRAVEAANSQDLLQTILTYLEGLKQSGELNNTGIPRMVRGYFYEMACIIAESARVLKPRGLLLMVNDNVRYAGASVSVDLILSDMAEKLGFAVEKILELPTGKGNSSQQMGAHGRDRLRKCIYIWRKN